MGDGRSDAERIRAVERWFVRRGLPHAIDDYRASTDVFTRAAPFLSLVFVIELFASFGDRFSGWAQAGVFVLGAAIMLGAAVGINRVRGRRPFQLPDDIGPLELTAFVLVPPILPALFGEDRATTVVAIVVLNLGILVLAYLFTSYGIVPMARWGAEQMLRQISGLSHLLARSLPFLLLFATFIFLNAEMWQVAHDFRPAFYAIVIGAVFAIALSFLLVRLPQELDGIAVFDDWDEICALAEQAEAPVGRVDRPDQSGRPQIEPLARGGRLNLVLLLFVSQVVQLVLVATVIGSFYVGFGLFSVREETLLQWTTATADTLDAIARFTVFGGEVVLTWELFAVSGFIAAFSALQFAVSLLTDKAYREEFFASLEHEAREVLAVRALYLTLVERAWQDQSSPTGTEQSQARNM